MAPYYSPNGDEITGTLERIYAIAKLSGVRLTSSGDLEPEYCGDTEVLWDTQETETVEGEIIFVCEKGREWKESEIEFRGLSSEEAA